MRRRYGKIYITDRGVLYARHYDELVEKILQHFPLAGEGFTPEECYSAAVAMAVSLPVKVILDAVFSDTRFARALDNLLDRKRGVTKEAMNAENAMGNDWPE